MTFRILTIYHVTLNNAYTCDFTLNPLRSLQMSYNKKTSVTSVAHTTLKQNKMYAIEYCLGLKFNFIN